MTRQQQIEQELSLKPFGFQQKVEACKALYLAYQGRHHDHIQIEMRKLGNDRWNNRCLYARWNNGKYLPGWPERFGWKNVATDHTDKTDRTNARSSRHSKSNTPPASGNSKVTRDRSPKSVRSVPSVANFLPWLKSLPGNYNWDWKFQRYVIEKLEAFERGDIKRLMLFVPPRHGKSELVTVRYAAWHLQNNPKSNIIIGSYNQNLANRFSRKIRNVYAEAAAVAAADAGADAADLSVPGAVATGDLTMPSHDQTKCDICIAKATECPHAANAGNAAAPAGNAAANAGNAAAPGCTAGSPGLSEANNSDGTLIPAVKSRRIQTDAEWETAEGGGVKAVGCGSGITGFGANLIIIDDPVKSRSEAESKTIRDKAYDWFNDDIYTRLEPDGKMILIQTRWHEDDLAGRLLREMREDEDAEQWEVIEFPAIAEAGRSGGVKEKGSRGDTLSDVSWAPVPASSTPQLLHSPTPALPNTSTPRLYYVRNSQHIPIHTLGNGAKKKKLATDHTDKTDKENTSSLGTDNCPSTGHPDGIIPSTSLSVPSVQSVANSLTDILGRHVGEALCPERYPIERLLRSKKRLGTYSFSALYQQRPIPAEGGFFKRHWFKIVDHIPPGLKWKRGYDLGISASPGADYTATARVAFDEGGNMYIDRVLRRRMEYPEQRRAILGLIATEHDTEHFIEKSANGNAVIQDLRRERGISERHFRGVEVRESKTARAFTWNALAEEGRVHLIRSAWNTEFIDEACSFPGGVNDDQIDAVSIAVKMLREEKKRGAHGF